MLCWDVDLAFVSIMSSFSERGGKLEARSLSLTCLRSGRGILELAFPNTQSMNITLDIRTAFSVNVMRQLLKVWLIALPHSVKFFFLSLDSQKHFPVLN